MRHEYYVILKYLHAAWDSSQNGNERCFQFLSSFSSFTLYASVRLVSVLAVFYFFPPSNLWHTNKIEPQQYRLNWKKLSYKPSKRIRKSHNMPHDVVMKGSIRLSWPFTTQLNVLFVQITVSRIWKAVLFLLRFTISHLSTLKIILLFVDAYLN